MRSLLVMTTIAVVLCGIIDIRLALGMIIGIVSSVPVSLLLGALLRKAKS